MKLNILFVDDEPNILSGLRRTLRMMRSCWSMDFANSGQEALTRMEQNNYDVVVTDFLMPGMNGAELLHNIQQKYPDTVRIVLSGQTEKESIIKLVSTAHRYLSKPCSAELLQSTIENASWLKNITNATIRKVTSQVKSLPSLPSVYSDLIKELQSENSSLRSIGELIAQDIGMSTKVLQLVNSAYFGLPRHVSNTVDAVILLGIETVMALVLTSHIFSQFDQNRITDFSVEKLMRHSFSTGVLAKRIAKHEELPKDHIDFALIAGSLHDCGKLLLASAFPQEYKAVIKIMKDQGIECAVAEKEIFDISHAEVGGALLGLWGLPIPIAEIVLFHHSLNKVQDPEFSSLTTVHAANSFDYDYQNGSIINEYLNMDYLTKVDCTDKIPVWRELKEDC